jgi:hypothetical protein
MVPAPFPNHRLVGACNPSNCLTSSCLPSELIRRGLANTTPATSHEPPNNPETQFSFRSRLSTSASTDIPHSNVNTRRNLNETIHSKTDEGDAPCKHSCSDGDHAFETIPPNLVKYSSRFPRWAIVSRATASLILEDTKRSSAASTEAAPSLSPVDKEEQTNPGLCRSAGRTRGRRAAFEHI